MTPLRDKEIRTALLNRLEKQEPKAIVQELRIDDGRAVADVVALFSEAHCYEIKGTTDKIDRLKTQGHHFGQAFPKVTLVTTENHLRQALKVTPAYWGILIAKASEHPDLNTKVRFSHVRRARSNPDFCKSTALLTLWKQEMFQLLDREETSLKRQNRMGVADYISKKLSKTSVLRSITEILVERSRPVQPKPSASRL